MPIDTTGHDDPAPGGGELQRSEPVDEDSSAGVSDVADFERSVRNLTEYLRYDSDAVCFVYEPAYAHIAAALAASAPIQGLAVTPIDLRSVDAAELPGLTAGRPTCFAFDRRYGAAQPVWQGDVVRLVRDRGERTFTLCDCAHRFEQIFAVPPGQITDLNRQLAAVVREASELSIVDDLGTKLTISLSAEYDWVSIDGFSERAHDLTINLPPGEVATYPASVNGRIVFCGALLGTIPIGRKYGLITAPFTLTIVDGIVDRIDGAPDGLSEDLELCLRHAPFADAVCEIGLGTHSGIRTLEGLNYSYEEKHYGFHIGFGASLAQQNVERVTDHHLDLLVAQCVVYADGRLLFDGEYHLENE